MLKKKMKKERIYTVKNMNDFKSNRNEETKFSFNLPQGITPDMICQIINRGNLHKDSFREYMLADTRKEIAMKIHNYWKDHSKMLYSRSSRSYMWLYYNEITRKKITNIAERKHKTIIIYDLHDEKTKKGEMKR